MTAPLVSVLMPVYNAADTLPETLQSIRDQTFDSFEIIAVDDGSEDGSLGLLENWYLREARLIISSQPHRGLIDTLNTGLSLCRGEYIARMDADDLMHPDRLKKQVALLSSRADVSVASCLVETIAEGSVGEGMRIYETWLNGLIHHQDINREIFIESPIAHPSAMVRREELLALAGYRECGWPEDYDLWLRYSAAGKRFEKVPEVLLYWRDHDQRATRTDSRYSVENFIKAKAHFLANGLLRDYEELIIWGAGQTGRRLSKHLIGSDRPPRVFIDINEDKIGSTLRGIPVSSPDTLADIWAGFRHPVLLVAVASRGARQLIRERLLSLDIMEGVDFFCVA